MALTTEQQKMKEAALAANKDWPSLRHMRDHHEASNPAAILAILAQLEQVQGWVSVDAEQKPVGRIPILVAVSCIKFGEHEDGTPGEGHSRVVTEGEYIPKHGDSGDYFTAYASPMADQEWITHWREIPPPPEAACHSSKS